MHYKSLLAEAEKEEIEIVEMDFLSKRTKGFYEDNIIALSRGIETTAERTCILAEELGHYYTTVGNILDQTKIENRKQELRARRWAVDRLIRVEDFIDAFNEGVRNRAELAEFLDVTEDFIDMSLDHFQKIHGHSHTRGDYTIYFSPLYVYKSIT